MAKAFPSGKWTVVPFVEGQQRSGEDWSVAKFIRTAQLSKIGDTDVNVAICEAVTKSRVLQSHPELADPRAGNTTNVIAAIRGDNGAARVVEGTLRWDPIAYSKPLVITSYAYLPETMTFATIRVSQCFTKRYFFRTELEAIYGMRQMDSFLFPLYAALHQWDIAAKLVNVWWAMTTRTLDHRRAASTIATWASHCALYLEDGRGQSRAQLHMQAACLTHAIEESATEHKHIEAHIPQTSIGGLPEEVLLLILEYAVHDRSAPMEYTRYNERSGKRFEGKQPWLADIQHMGIPLVSRRWNRIFNSLVDDLTVTISMSDWRDNPWNTTPLMVVHPKSYVALQCARRITLDCSVLPLFAAHPLPTQLADILRSRECLPEIRFSAPQGPDTFLPYFPDYLPFASRIAYLRDLLEPIAAVYAARHMTFAVRVPDWGNAVQCVRASPGPLRGGEWSLLLWAAYSGSRAVASLALGAQDHTLEEVLNWRNMSDETPLYMAAKEGNLDVARLLLSYEETFIDCMTLDGRTPLLCAAASGHTTLVEELLLCISDRYSGEEKAQILDAREECGGTTPLIAAAIQGHDGVVAALLQAGVDSDAIDYRGHTALRAAVKFKHSKTQDLLRSWDMASHN